jgi:hypothetical protein
MDIVWNRNEAEQIRLEFVATMNRQAGHMRNTVAEYRRQAEELEQQVLEI